MKKIILTLSLLISCNVSAVETDDFDSLFTTEKIIEIKRDFKKDHKIVIYRNDIDGECYAALHGGYKGGFSLVKCSSFGLISPEQFLKENK